MQKTDREQIQELMSIYARAIDTRDYNGLTACFVADATAEYAGFTAPLAGRDAIMAHMKKALDPLAVTQHLFMNFIIDVDGDTGHLSAGIIAQHVKTKGGETYLAGGQYEVDVKRDGARWLIAGVNAQSAWGMGERGLLPKE